MKKLLAVLGFAMVVNAGAVALASESTDALRNVNLAIAGLKLASVQPLDLINWKVGDTASYTLDAGMLGTGTMVKTANKEEGDAIWVHQEISIAGQQQTVDTLINRADGKILKLIENGQDTAVPDTKITVVSQEYTSITVAAGTFKCMHIVATSDQAKNLEVWADPKDTVLDGSLKEIVDTGMITMTLELQSFAHGS